MYGKGYRKISFFGEAVNIRLGKIRLST